MLFDHNCRYRAQHYIVSDYVKGNTFSFQNILQRFISPSQEIIHWIIPCATCQRNSFTETAHGIPLIVTIDKNSNFRITAQTVTYRNHINFLLATLFGYISKSSGFLLKL